MNIDEYASIDVNTHEGGNASPCTELTLDALPEVQKLFLAENSHTGVSTKNALSGTDRSPKKVPEVDNARWYALRTTYGREKKACDYIINKGGTAFCPTFTIIKVVDGKRRKVEESCIPNIFFAYGTEAEIKSFVYDNVNLPYLRFYYRHIRFGGKKEKEPLIIPDYQIESFRIICTDDAEDIIVSTDEIPKFQQGQLVRIIEGKFKGVVGHVTRYQGQQRVGIVIDGLLSIATAYIPSAFLESITK